MFNNRVDMTMRGNTVIRGFGEGMYISGTYFKSTDQGCVTWGQTHRFILLENNAINQANGNVSGEPDGIDMKAGLRDVTVRGNNLTMATTVARGMIITGIFPNASPDITYGDRSNYYIENNYVHDGAGNCIDIQNQNYTVIRNNVLSHCGPTRTGILNDQGSVGWPYSTIEHEDIYDNDIATSTAAIDLGSISHNTRLRNNVLSNFTGTNPEFASATGSTMDSDYNVRVSGHSNSSSWVEGSNTISLPNATTIYTNEASGDFTLQVGSPVVGVGISQGSTFIFDKAQVQRTISGSWDSGAYTLNTSCIPAKLVITGQPTTANLTASIGTIIVTIEDSSNNVCSTATNTVTLAKNASATWGTLSGTTSTAAVAGNATFTDNTVTVTAGAGSIDAASTGLTGTSTNSITIASPPCVPAKLIFTSQPANARAGQPLGTIGVTVKDASNVVCTADTSLVTLSNHAGTCTGMTLSGQVSSNAIAGLFSTTSAVESGNTGNCQIDASSSGLTGATSNVFAISSPATNPQAGRGRIFHH
jgi:hypothetical protein